MLLMASRPLMRQLEIHQRDVRMVPAEERERLFSGRRHADHLHVGLHVDDERHAVAHDGMIVNAQDPDS
jgi:hypothetical protein